MDKHTVTELEKINKNGTEKEISETKNEILDTQRHLPYKRQALASLGAFMLTVSVGATSGISAIIIPQLKEAKGKDNVSIEMISWVAAISSFALVFGNLTSGFLMERYGRRQSHLMLATCFVVGWIIIGLSSDIMALLLFGRFITGFCQGWLGPLAPVFVGEISTPTYRGLFLAALSLGIAFGVFVSHLFGTFLNWSYASLLCGLFPMIGGFIIYYVPESPAWFASRNRIDECIMSFQWYRGKSDAVKSELDKMIVEQARRNKVKGKLETLKENIKKPEFWKPLGIMTTFFFITQLSGINVICAYTTDIMNELIGNNSGSRNANAAMLSIDVLRCVSLAIACILLRKYGRRPLAILSGVFTSISLITLSMYLYLVNIGTVSDISPFISLGLMAFYMIVSSLGMPLPWNMVGELFAAETKSLGSGVSVMMTSVTFFGVVKTAPAMFKSIGHHGTYLFYGVSTLLGTIFLCLCLPETKGKTLLEIEEYFRYGKKNITKSSNSVKNGKDILSNV